MGKKLLKTLQGFPEAREIPTLDIIELCESGTNIHLFIHVGALFCCYKWIPESIREVFLP